MRWLLVLLVLLASLSAWAGERAEPPTAVTAKGMVVTCQPLAGQVGVEILRRGGNAADAFIAATLAEYVTASGYTSLSGPLSLLYYDARAKRSAYLNAGLNTVSDPAGQWSDSNPSPGKSYVIGGAGRGLEALYRRFGGKRLAFSDLAAPSVKIAREGFLLSPWYAWSIANRAPLFKASPEWNALFLKNGVPLKVGEKLVQTEFAETLSRFGREGADFLFKGQFAKDLVARIQAQGGKLTLKDLADYKVAWGEPLETKYRDVVIQTSSFRSYGGLELLLDLKTIENMRDLSSKPHFSKDPEVFNTVLRTFLFTKRAVFPFMDFGRRVDDPAAMKKIVEGDLPAKIWSQVRDPKILNPWTPDRGHHSCHTIVVDRAGNIATGTHTINSFAWGDYGLMVNGVSLNSAHLVALNAPPGSRAIDGLNPTLVFKNGKPIIAAGFFSSALHPAAFQVLLNLLDYGMSSQQALDAPRFGVVNFAKRSILVDARYPTSWLSVFAKQGIPLSQPSGFIDTGMGMLLQIDPATGLRRGSATELVPSSVVMTE